jgi:hypothetical protein
MAKYWYASDFFHKTFFPLKSSPVNVSVPIKKRSHWTSTCGWRKLWQIWIHFTRSNRTNTVIWICIFGRLSFVKNMTLRCHLFFMGTLTFTEELLILTILSLVRKDKRDNSGLQIAKTKYKRILPLSFSVKNNFTLGDESTCSHF